MRKILYILCICGALLITACKTCPPPEIIYTPQPYPVPVYQQPAPLEIPPPPVLEACVEMPVFGDKVRCIGTNIKRLERYSEELLIILQSHNAAIPKEES